MRPIFIFLFSFTLLYAAEDNHQIILNAQRFQSGVVGESGKKSEIVSEYFKILANQDGVQIFDKIFNESTNNVAKAYALQGLFKLDKKLYLSRKSTWSGDESIKTQIFGIIGSTTVKEFAKMIESGEIDRILNWSHHTDSGK